MFVSFDGIKIKMVMALLHEPDIGFGLVDIIQ